jgi:hypothetical protein
LKTIAPLSLLALVSISSCAAITQLDKYEEVACVDCDHDAALVTMPDVVDASGCGHLFCSDFDEGTFEASGWPDHSSNSTVTIQIDQRVYHSAPASYFVSVPAAAGDASGGTLSKNFGLPLTSAHLRFWILVSTLPQIAAGNSIQVATIGASQDFTNGGGGASIVWTSGGLAVSIVTPSDDGGTTSTLYPFSKAPTTSVWSQIGLDVTFSSAGEASFTALLNGDTVATGTKLTTAADSAKSTTLVLGLSTVGTTPALQLNFDDLTFDLDD